MGFIRGGLLVVVSVLFFILLLLADTLFVVSESLEYENIKSEVIPSVVPILEEEYALSENIKEVEPYLKEYCQNNSEYVFAGDESSVFKIDCSSVGNSSEAIVENAVENFVENNYYKNYNCSFVQCFENKEKPFFLISEQTKNYFSNKFYFVLLIAVTLIIFIFFLVENKTNVPILVGSLIIVSSLPFIKLEYLFEFFSKGFVLRLLSSFFTQSYSTFIKLFIIGVVVLLFGVALKFFKIGFWISGIINRRENKNEKSNSTSVKKPLSNSNNPVKSSKNILRKNKI